MSGLGGNSGSREPDPSFTGSGPAGFDPGRVRFTPGPWTIGPWIDSLGGHVYRTVSGAKGKLSGISVYGKRPDGTVAGRTLKYGNHTKTVASEECDANAYLIAAAPDLYDALNELVETLRKEAPGTPLNNHRFNALGMKAYRALAKARGEA